MAFWHHYDRSEGLKTEQAKSIALFQRFFSKEFGLPVYPHFGSLLGIVRDQDFIPWDHDTDMAFLSSKNTAKEVQEELVMVLTRLRELGLLIKYWKRPKGQGGRMVQIDEFIQDGHEIQDPDGQAYVWVNNTYIDLYVDWIDESGNYWTCTVGTLGTAEEFFPTDIGLLRGHEIDIPRNADTMLERIYGDWQTPNSNMKRGEGMTARPVRPYLITQQV